MTVFFFGSVSSIYPHLATLIVHAFLRRHSTVVFTDLFLRFSLTVPSDSLFPQALSPPLFYIPSLLLMISARWYLTGCCYLKHTVRYMFYVCELCVLCTPTCTPCGQP